MSAPTDTRSSRIGDAVNWWISVAVACYAILAVAGVVRWP